MGKTKGTAFAVLGAVAGLCSFAWPFHSGLEYGQPVWALQLVSLYLYAVALRIAYASGASICIGFVYHFVLLVGSVYWLHIAMDTYGGVPRVLAWVAVSLLCAALSVYGAATAWLYARIVRKQPKLTPLAFAVCWLMAELARGQWLTGFGWAGAAYAHVEGPLAALAQWLGGYGIALVAAFFAGSLANVRRKMDAEWISLLGLSSLIVLANFSPEFTQRTEPLSTALLQGNIAQDEKFDSSKGVVDSLAWYGSALDGQSAALVLAPETAIPVLPQQLPEGYIERMVSVAERKQSVLLVGMPLGNHQAGYTNSVIAVGPEQANPYYRYDKNHLVPFGEFIPPFFQWFVRMMNIPLGDFERGDLQQPPVISGRHRVAPSICYEDLFSEELALRFKVEELSPTIFANFSNLAWFGNSTAMYQHLHISRMRSLEFGRPFLRVSNNGITSVVDHQGHVTARMEPFTRGVLYASVEGRTGLTPYAWWSSRWGTWPWWGLALGLLLWTTAIRRIENRSWCRF